MVEKHNDRQLQILIVDDEEIIRETLTDYFEFMGHKSRSVDNGKDGIDALESGDFDIAFVDIKMPGMSGIDFLKQVKGKKLGVPVVIMSGHGTDDIKSVVLEAGAADFCFKPFGFKELKSVIDSTF